MGAMSSLLLPIETDRDVSCECGNVFRKDIDICVFGRKFVMIKKVNMTVMLHRIPNLKTFGLMPTILNA